MTETVIKTGDRVRIEHFMGTREGTYLGHADVPQGANRVVDVDIAGEGFTVAARLYLIKSAAQIAEEKAKQEKQDKINEVMTLASQLGDSRFNEGAYWERKDLDHEDEAAERVRELREEIRKKLEELL